MKKFSTLLFFSILLLSFQSNAQKWVSTTPQNKNVVLEEFTGVNCGYCPDGHRMAMALAASNPGRVVLINIHAGPYATPSTGELDLRTPEGDSLNTTAAIAGYPSGSVNRSTSPWGQDRSTWNSLASGILSQTSPVNVFVKASVDYNTKTLTAEVEVYYTSNSPSATNYLTVDLLQDNILGYQDDYGNFNPDYWMGTNYRHMHALRKVLSAGGAYGEALDTTTSGKYYYRKYVLPLPASITNVNLVWYQLKVAAFVSEYQKSVPDNILTGSDAYATYDSTLITDLSLKDLTTYPTSLCVSSFDPKVQVTNLLNNSVTKFKVSAMLGSTTYTKDFNGTLAMNQSTTIDFGNLPYMPTGNYTLSLWGFDSINGVTLFERNWDNNAVKTTGIGLMQNAFTTVTGSFEGSVPANFAFDYSQNSTFSVVYSTSPTYGAKGTSGAIRFPLNSSWGVSGKPGNIIFGQADFTSVTNPYLTFYYAYSDDAYGGTAPLIKVYVSEDCGSTWTDIRDITCVQTGVPSTHGNWYVPTSAQYTWVGTSLSSYASKKVLIKISGIPGTNGNALYIDEISVGSATGISETVTSLPVSLYPNPVQDNLLVEYGVTKEAPVKISVYNNLGQVVYSNEIGVQTPGNYSKSIMTSEFSRGIYILKFSDGNNETTKKFIKE